MTWSLGAAAAMAAVGAVSGAAVPTLIQRIPEPEPPAPEEDHGGDHDDREPEEPKQLYADIGRSPGLLLRAVLACAVIGGLIGARVGWEPALLIAAYLVPVGVALSVVDWRTRLLPTWVIAPSYGVVVVLAVVAAWIGGDWDDLVRAGAGWLVAGGLFFLMWVIYPAGMGYGDVRLSGLLGIALGFLGWGELMVGLFASSLLGGLGGGLLSMLRIVDRKAYPFGPFMLLGAVVGVLLGPAAADLYAP